MKPELDGTGIEPHEPTSQAMGVAVAIMARLRGPQGCAWDREQTFDSIKRHTLEETYEVFDAIERRDWPALKDELGDLLLQVLFYAQMAQDEGHFTMEDVADNLSAKLLRRHPHVFGEAVAENAEAVVSTWESVKREEKKASAERAGTGLLEDVPRSMPAVMEAHKLGSKASKVGFDWPDSAGLFAKLDEEIAELMVEVELGKKEQVEEEFGDLMFTAVNLARHLRIDAEGALRGANAKFRRRFGSVETEAGGHEAMEAMDIEQLEALWMKAKRKESK
ncbi:MAG: nucleoside triphosphate pyrophosphohydrolase [Acidobacteriaceae bacterium]|nr:nucleoside triphosphate pyrophosphohydrolase [Acidobacteriaceae bacterium]